MTRLRGLFQERRPWRGDGAWFWRPWVFVAQWTVSIAVMVSLLVGGLVVAVGYFERRTCYEKVEALHRDSRWGYFSGCLVDDGDRWVPLDNWRRNEESGPES